MAQTGRMRNSYFHYPIWAFIILCSSSYREGCLDPVLPVQSAKAIQSFIDQYAISDVWRFFNPKAKQYSFFSPVHHSFSCIDFFVLDNRLLPFVLLLIYSYNSYIRSSISLSSSLHPRWVCFMCFMFTLAF